MSENKIRNKSFREALFSGTADVEGLEAVLGLYRDLFPLTDPVATDLRELREDEVNMRLEEGFTLVEPVEILPGADILSQKAREVAAVLAVHSEGPEAVNTTVEKVLEAPEIFHELASVYLKEGEAALREKLVKMDGVNPEVVMFMLFNSLKGAFLGAAHQFVDMDTDKWEHGQCPVCAGEPAVAYTIGEGGKRHLICHRCETTWRFRRLTCPYCGHENPEESGYLFSEDPEYRAMTSNVCGECRSYIKSWRVEGDDLDGVHPEVEDLKTPGFDSAVEVEKYRRGAPNIFGVWIGSTEEK